MARSTKAITCPQCGSTEKTGTRTDQFCCGNCGTQYFLDSDDITVNHVVRHAPAPRSAVAPARSRGVAVGLGLAVLVVPLLIVTAGVFSWTKSEPRQRVSAGEARERGFEARTGEDVAEAPRSDEFKWGSTERSLYLDGEGRPTLFVVGERRYESSERDGYFASFYDPSTGAERKSVPLPDLNGKKSVDLALKAFASGELYVVANKTRVYEVDKTTSEARDVTKTLFEAAPELSVGVASVEALRDSQGDGFSVFTNDGRTVVYFPRIQKAYTKDAFYEAGGGMKNAAPKSPTRTVFTFSSKSSSYPEDKLQLIKYQFRDNEGGPKDAARFSWDRDYGGSGIFTSADPFKKRLITPWQMNRARVVSFDDFTPDRLYFSPEVMYYDAEQVLISFRPTAAEDSAPVAQLLDAKTGAIAFTTPLPEDLDVQEAVRSAEGFVLRGRRTTVPLSADGAFGAPVTLP